MMVKTKHNKIDGNLLELKDEKLMTLIIEKKQVTVSKHTCKNTHTYTSKFYLMNENLLLMIKTWTINDSIYDAVSWS